MSSRIRRPETCRLPLSQGDWLLVKKHLTAGEQRRIFSRMYRSLGTGIVEVDPLQTGLSKMVEYLLDWSITDGEGRPIVIRDQPVEVVVAALEAIDPEDFQEFLTAIDTHDAAMAEARAQEKKLRNGAPASSAISASVG